MLTGYLNQMGLIAESIASERGWGGCVGGISHLKLALPCIFFVEPWETRGRFLRSHAGFLIFLFGLVAEACRSAVVGGSLS